MTIMDIHNLNIHINNLVMDIHVLSNNVILNNHNWIIDIHDCEFWIIINTL